ncbi:hypothetical protein FBU59_005870 [Linderina macrospora]|uniref:Uncharacterized protein n=1 Tax=Linderina macrospora TaxID=4868 RepID=A0ACC1J1G1_9FUNG|nr:hypothetical protein FBU59_005870 [Linderina macrospora]
MNLEGLSENEMWQKRQEWNQGIGRTMEILYTHIMFDMARIKAHRIALMILLHEDLDMVRNFQYSKAFSVQELPCLTGSTAAATTMPILATYEDDAEAFQRSVQASSEAATHVYSLLKFTYEFGIDLHAFTTVIIGALFQLALVYVGRVQSCSPRMAWCAMLRLARILAMIRSLDRWGPALYIFTNILKALGRPELLLQAPSPQTRAELAAETSRSTFPAARSPSVDSSVDSLSCYQGDVGSGLGANKRKSCVGDIRGDEKRYEFMDHHHGDNPATVMAATGWSSPAEEEDVTNPFPPDHVITHIMREQKVNTATFFSPTLPILAASLLHTNSG